MTKLTTTENTETGSLFHNFSVISVVKLRALRFFDEDGGFGDGEALFLFD